MCRAIDEPHNVTISLQRARVAFPHVIRPVTPRVLAATLVAALALPLGAAAPVSARPTTGQPAPERVAPGVPASSVDGRISVRLVGLDGRTTTAVISSRSTASWNGSPGYAALKAERIGSNRYRISASTTRVCPGAEALTVPNGILSRGRTGTEVEQLQAVLGALGYAVGPIDGIFGPMTEEAVRSFQRANGLTVDGSWKNVDAERARVLIAALGTSVWTEIGVANGPVRFVTGGSETNLAPGDTLGVCRSDGQVTHYRGAIIAVTDSTGTARTVNEVGVENYLRGVVPREVSASWGTAGNGAGMHALRAQAVAARSYALSQNRYAYAKTCDTTACQAYGGAARRTGAAASASSLEHPLTDQAIRETAGVVRVWPDGRIVSTEYSASNGPRTAGGAFPAVDDVAGDGVPANPNHRWTRVLSAAGLVSRYGVGSPLRSATTPESSSMRNQGFEGIWARFVRIEGSSSTRTETAWNFRGSYGFPSPGFQFSRVEGRNTDARIAIIGDSVGASVLGPSSSDPGPLRTLLTGAFASNWYDALSSRPTGPASNPVSGLAVAERVPRGTDLVIVQLGYNDPTNYGPKVDQMMATLRARDVRQVVWVNLSTRRGSTRDAYTEVNRVLAQKASADPMLTVLDWNARSTGSDKNRWFTDGVHLTATGRAEFARFLDAEARRLTPGTSNGRITAVLVDGVGFGHGRGMSQWGAYGWAVTQGRTWQQILDHYYGGTANATVATGGDRNESVTPATGATPTPNPNPNPNPNPAPPVDTVQKVPPNRPLRTKIAGVAGVPADGSATAVALNVTVTDPDAWGYLTVWPCGSPRPVASNVNFLGRGAVEPNAVIVQLDQTGEVCSYSSADAHVIIDVAGWFTDGFQGVVPTRLVDTRSGVGAERARVRPDRPLRVSFANRPEAANAVGVALNVTALDPTGSGYLTVWPCGAQRPVASNVNYAGSNSVEPNLVLVDLDETREVCIHSFAPAHVLVDLAGLFTSGFEGVVPTRVVDTRTGVGAARARVRPEAALRVPVVGQAGVPASGAVAAVLNVTAVDTTSAGFLTVWPCGASMPVASNVNFTRAGAVEPNAVIVQLDQTGEVCIHTSASTHVIVDVGGWFSGGFQGIVPTRVVDTRRPGGR